VNIIKENKTELTEWIHQCLSLLNVNPVKQTK
jgi:hypothetical protein